MLTARFGRALTRPCFRRLAASLVLTATAPTMAGAQVAPQPGATPAQMMERMCADHDAHFAARMAFLEAKIGLEAAQRPAWEAFVGAMRAAEKPIRDMCQSPPPPSADDPVAQLEALDRRAIARSDARRAACRCCAPQERAGVGPATPAGGGDLAAGPLAAARSARTTRRRSTKPPARLWTLASAAAAAAVNHYRHPCAFASYYCVAQG